MKTTISLFLALALLAGLCACGGGASEAVDADPLEILTAVWDSYGEDEKFAVYGGGPDGEAMVDGAPGAFDLTDSAALDAMLGFPAGEAGRIDGAASLTHMLNANTFTCGVFHAAPGEDPEALAQAVEEGMDGREWICGFPEQLVIAAYGNCLVLCFGARDLTDAFLAKLTGAFPEAVTLCDRPIL